MKTLVLRGGPSGEHDVSLKTGATFLENLSDTYTPYDVVIGRDGVWRLSEREVSPARMFAMSDVVINALHGTFGEDGTIQHYFENARIPFTGSGSVESRIAMNKRETKRILQEKGIKTPDYIVIPPHEPAGLAAARVYNRFSMPCVVKPMHSGSSLGVSLVDRKELIEYAIEDARTHGAHVLVEAYVRGKEATCGVLEHFRGEHVYALPPIEICSNASFFDYDAKYGGGSQELCPGRFSSQEKRDIENIARTAHAALGLRHYSRTDMILAPNGDVYMLEVNTLPGMTQESLFPRALTAVGSSVKEFVEHVVRLSIEDKR